MGLKKIKEIKNTGIDVEYHKILSVIYDLEGGMVNVTIGSYINKDGHDNGKEAISRDFVNLSLDDFDIDGSFIKSVYKELKKNDKFTGAIEL